VEFVDSQDTGVVESYQLEVSKRDIAADTITELLTNGEVPCSEIYAKCLELGLKERTVDTAKKELGVRSIRKNNVWYWSL
jgi:hypothetical protein